MENEQKDCAFQYALDDGTMLIDTDLISIDEAEGLWAKYLPQFKEDIEMGKNPEMVFWVDMRDCYDYVVVGKHLRGEDCVIKDGKIYQLVEVEE